MPNNRNDASIDRDNLEKFLQQVPNLSEVIDNHTQLVAYFGYYLTEQLGEKDITPKRLRACYDAASVGHPSKTGHLS